jgi:hypothetical protein
MAFFNVISCFALIVCSSCPYSIVINVWPGRPSHDHHAAGWGRGLTLRHRPITARRTSHAVNVHEQLIRLKRVLKVIEEPSGVAGVIAATVVDENLALHQLPPSRNAESLHQYRSRRHWPHNAAGIAVPHKHELGNSHQSTAD